MMGRRIRPEPNLRQQAEAVTLAAANLRGHINNLVRLVSKGERPQHELDHFRSQYPALAAAASTLAVMAEEESRSRSTPDLAEECPPLVVATNKTEAAP